MIILSQPCKEDWNRMAPADKGRFCASCSKVVTDFAGLSKEEVMAVLREKRAKGQEICGRFRKDHLTTPAEAVAVLSHPKNRHLPRVRTFLAVLLLVFGATLFTGCSDTPGPKGKRVTVETRTPAAAVKGWLDTSAQVIGQFMRPKPTTCDVGVQDGEIYEVAGVEPADFDVYPDSTVH